MAKLSKEQVMENLEILGVEYDKNADYGDLCKLLQASKQMPDGKIEIVETTEPAPVVQPQASENVDDLKKKAGQAKQQMVNAVGNQYALSHGTKIYVPKELATEQKLEKMIRAFVKRSGGWRKGLSDVQIEQGKELLKKAGRDPENPVWDMGVALPGYDTM